MPRNPRVGFTLVELMVAVAILSLILVLILGITQQAATVWRSTRSKIEAFQDARGAFEIITRALSQATLNTYYDYFDNAGNPTTTSPHHYGRQSDLHFLSTRQAIDPNQVTHAVFFQSPIGFAEDQRFQGMDRLLNESGFYITHGQDPFFPPFLGDIPAPPKNPVRYRLMQFLQPTESLGVYGGATGTTWITQPLASSLPPIRQLAQNVIALVVLPKVSSADDSDSASLAPDYEYDSRRTSGSAVQLPTENQLPPIVELVMVAVDEGSAGRLEENTSLLGIDSLFQDAAVLDEDVNGDASMGDVDVLENRLAENRMTYRVFRTSVSLRNSKWSGE